MVSLELARLVKASLGVGLLPFSYAGILAAGLVRFISGSLSIQTKRGGVPRWRRLRWAGVGFWVMFSAVFAVGMASLIEEHGVDVETRQKYPTIDEWTDRAVIIGVGLVEAVLEGLGAWEGGWRDR